MNPDVLRMLAILGRPLTSPHEYAQRLAGSPDEYLRVAGLAALLDLGALPRAQWEEAVVQSGHGAVAVRAFKFFVANFEYGLAERVISTFEPSERPEAAEIMRASLKLDAGRLVDMHARQFLAELRIECLMAAAEHADTATGWRGAVPWLARATVVQPSVPTGAWHLLRVLETANQYEAIEQVLPIFEKGGVFGELRAVFAAVLLLHKKDGKTALQAISKLRLADIRSVPLKARLCHVRAEAYQALGQYRDALKLYQEFNKQGAPGGVDKRAYLATIERLARASYPALSDDAHPHHVMMVGFPRSGTTLLEHALAAHPAVETFEEVPSLTSMIVQVERVLAERAADEGRRRAALEQARGRYYEEIERRKSKPGARVFVDKLPIRSAWIEVLEKFFPDKRYIFSVRHPYDVVLSCFRQPFTPNAAMENFRTLEDACEFYDRVMSIWFRVFPGESERVLHVRYEELATDFEREAGRALSFVGVDWSDEVLRFAELSERRKAATPSYGMVRAGLEVGIQSSWKNYRFAFDSPHGAKLHKWVDRFGYER